MMSQLADVNIQSSVGMFTFYCVLHFFSYIITKHFYLYININYKLVGDMISTPLYAVALPGESCYNLINHDLGVNFGEL